MKSRVLKGVLLLLLLAVEVPLFAQSNETGTISAKSDFDPHNLNGSWLGVKYEFGDVGVNSVSEPPLTPWAKQHFLLPNISHAGLTSNIVDGNGVPASVTDGHYPGEMCQPIAAPAQFNYTSAYPFQFIVMPDRIYQMFENHREWRTIWLNREHPKDLIATYMGDSVAKWEGNTLVVDTIGYNGREWISENVGQYVSDSFRLVERYRLIDATHLDLEMTYYDPKAWGDQAWTGWKKEFKLDAKSDSLEEQMCDPAHWQNYDKQISNPVGEK